MNRLPPYSPPRRPQSKACPYFAWACVCFWLALVFFAAYRGTNDMATKPKAKARESEAVPDQDISHRLKMANVQMNAGNYNTARDMFRECNSPAGWSGAAECSLHLDEWKEMDQDCAHLVGDPNWAGKFHLCAGLKLLRQGRANEARPRLEVASRYGERAAALELAKMGGK